MLLVALVGVGLAGAARAADVYPTEVWPDETTVLGLNNTTNDWTGLPYIAAGTNAQSTPTLREQYDRRLYRQNLILAAANAGRVVEVGDTTAGAFPCDFRLQGTDYHYPGETAIAITASDDTYYVYLDTDSDEGADGEVEVVTDATGWPADLSTFVPLAEVTVTDSVIASIVDRRNRLKLSAELAYDAGLAAIAALATTDGNFIVGNGSTWVAESGATALTSLDAEIAAIAALATTDGNFMVGNGSTWIAESGATARTSLGLGSIATQAANSVAITGGSISGITDLAVADGGTGASDAATARTNLGLGSIATQAANSVAITGGAISGITDLAVADGGTGGSDAATARTNLGLVIDTDVQAYDDDLAWLSVLTPTDSNFIVGQGAHWVAESGATARTSLGLGTIATQAANSVAITGGAISGITDLAVADGGTAASSAADARTNLGLAIDTDVQAYDADLAAVAGLGDTGLVARTGAGTVAARTIEGGTGITLTNGDGVAGNPSVALTAGEVALTHLADAVVDLVPQVNVSAGSQAGQQKTVTLQVQDADGNSLAQRFAVQFWIDDADFGAPDATGNAVANVATQLQQIVANAHYTAISNASGAVTFDLTVAAGGTRYVMAEVDGRIYSASVEITAP